MERPCQYPGCKTTLSEFVPLEVTLCGQHQYKLLKLRAALAQESLPEKDIQFIFYHQKGCTAYQLAMCLNIPLPTMVGYLKRGVLKACKCGRTLFFWNIPIEEIVRAMIIARNWISVWRLARTTSICKDTLLSYAREGYFGPFQFNLSGALSVKRAQIPGVLERFRTVRSLKLRKKRWPRKYLEKGEIAPGEIARRLQTSHNTVYYWMAKGRLPFQQRGKRLVVKKNDFKHFALSAITGRVCVRNRFLPVLRTVCDKNVS